MTLTPASVSVGMLVVAVCFAAYPALPDPSAVFAAIETSIAAQDYYKADVQLGSLMNELLASHVPPPVGQTHRKAWDAGRENSDVLGLVRQAREAWSQAARGDQPWDEVMVRLDIASGSAVALDSRLPLAVRYEQARTRYEAIPSNILLHQLTLRAYEAGENAAAFRYVTEERAEAPRIYGPDAGPIIHRLETLIGLLKLDAGDTEGALQALANSANALEQVSGRRLIAAPRMLLAQKLLHAGQTAPVLAYLEVCEQFKYPGGEEYTDVGPNPRAVSQLISAIRAGREPDFGNVDIY